MRYRNFKLPFFTVLIFALSVMSSCKDEWDNHYYATNTIKSDFNTFQFIESREELKIFTQMLKNTGYDSVLIQSQAFTVWAPVDEALKGINLSDKELVQKIVSNHITRFSHASAEISKKSKVFTMLNTKQIEFSLSYGKLMFGKIEVLFPDLATQNGIVHIIKGYSPYTRNFWEFLNEATELDSLRTYINSLTMRVLDEDASYDSDNVLVDSIFKNSNLVLDRLAALNNEDSIYTAIFPNNTSWTESYNKIYPYFKTTTADGGKVVQRKYTQINLVKDLFFRGKMTLPTGKDTLTSTNRNYFINPDRLFSDAQLTELSNGNCYVSNQLKAQPSESWVREIRVEAEYADGRLPINYSVSRISGLGTGMSISNGNYILTNPLSASDLSSVNSMSIKFDLPNTLSTKYNIYCVFVPATIVNANDTLPNKVRFFFSYMKSNEFQSPLYGVNSSNELGSSTTISGGAIFQVNQKGITKMLVLKDFEFPFSNMITYDPKTLSLTQSTASLRINNAAKATEKAFSRFLRIDCIILEPVQ